MRRQKGLRQTIKLRSIWTTGSQKKAVPDDIAQIYKNYGTLKKAAQGDTAQIYMKYGTPSWAAPDDRAQIQVDYVTPTGGVHQTIELRS